MSISKTKITMVQVFQKVNVLGQIEYSFCLYYSMVHSLNFMVHDSGHHGLTFRKNEDEEKAKSTCPVLLWEGFEKLMYDTVAYISLDRDVTRVYLLAWGGSEGLTSLVIIWAFHYHKKREQKDERNQRLFL